MNTGWRRFRQRGPRAVAWLLLAVAVRLPATLPDPLTLEDALRLAGDNHPSLALSRAALEVAEAGADHAAAQDDVDIGARLEARLIDPSNVADDQSRNDSRATLYATKRLDDFGHTDALEARLRQLEYDLREEILDVWLEIRTLHAQREQVKIFTEARDRDFERAQAEYELELKTDFGDALVGQSESNLLAARTEFQLAVDWARLSALTGASYSPYLPGASPSSSRNDSHDTNAR